MPSYLAIVLLGFSGLCYSATQPLSSDSVRHYFNFDTEDDIRTNSGKSIGKLIGARIDSDKGKTGGGLVLSNNSHVLTMSGIDLGGLEKFSISAWIKPSNFMGYSTEGRVISKSSGTQAAQHNWMLGLGGDGTAIRFRVKTSVRGTSTLSTLQGQIKKGQWTHIAAVYTGEKMEVYVNGVLSAAKAKTGTVIDSEAIDSSIGNQLPNLERRAFIGVIDELFVFNDALSGELLKKIVASESGVIPAAQVESEPTVESEPYGRI